MCSTLPCEDDQKIKVSEEQLDLQNIFCFCPSGLSEEAKGMNYPHNVYDPQQQVTEIEVLIICICVVVLAWRGSADGKKLIDKSDINTRSLVR